MTLTTGERDRERVCAFPPHPVPGDGMPLVATEPALSRFRGWLRHAPAERLPLPAVPVVWTATEIMHATGLSGVYVGVATGVAALAGGWAGEHRSGDPERKRLRGAEVAAVTGAVGGWMTLATAWGPLSGGMPYWLTILYLAGSGGGYWWLRKHDAVREARRRRDEAAAWEAQKTAWHRLAPALGLDGSHLLAHEDTLLGDTTLIDTRGTGRRASQISTRDVAERLGEIQMIPTGRIDVITDRLPGRLRISVRSKDPWQHPLTHPAADPASPYARHVEEPATCRKPLVIGADPETGTPLTLPLWDEEEGGKVVLVAAKKGSGKALALDTLLPTPAGWTTMGEVRIGDRVLGQDGKPARITAATEVMHGRPCYEVEFSDGTVIVADAEHRWLTEDRRSVESANNVKHATRTRVRHAFPAVRTTAEIAATLRYGWNQRLNHAVANCRPLDFPEADLPIPPYTLGAWLGDGVSRRAQIACDDPEIVALIEAECVQVTKLADRFMYSLRFPGVLNQAGKLRELGVLRNKHIPALYLRASQPQRRALLAGLLDTDGYCAKPVPRKKGDGLRGGGQVQLALTGKRLADDARELISGLGYTSRVTTKTVPGRSAETSTCYIVSFTPGDTVFRLPRKAARQGTAAWSGLSGRRFITAVRPVPSVPVRCIAVDNDDHLYLAGRTCIPTHNTVLLSCISERVTACTDAQLIQVNLGKHREDLRWAPLAAANALGRDEIGRARYILQWVFNAIEERSNGGSGSIVGPTPETPLLVVKIDEVDLVARDFTCKQLLADIASKCRSEAVALIIAGQRATAQWMGGADLRANVDIAVLGRFARASEASKATGEGIDLPDMGAYGEGNPGVFLITELGGGGTYERGRVFKLSDPADIEAIVARREAIRQPYVPEPALVRLSGAWEKITGTVPGRDDGYEDTDAPPVAAPAAGQMVQGTEHITAKISAAREMTAQDPEIPGVPPEMREHAEQMHAERRRQFLAALTDVNIPDVAGSILLGLLAADTGTSSRDAAVAISGKTGRDVGRMTVYRWLKRLEADGHAEIRGDSRKKQRFYLTDATRASLEEQFEEALDDADAPAGTYPRLRVVNGDGGDGQ
jgi:hypothetical protein